MDYVLLSELSLQHQNCKIKARVCRIWESTAPFLKGDIFGLDCLLVDEKGYSLQGTIRKQDAEEIRRVLKEGHVYLIEKFNVIPSKKKYIVVDRHYMVQINRWSCLSPLAEDVENIPLHSFSFSSFPEVEKRRYNDSVLTDVIGHIRAIGEITHKYVGDTRTPIRNLEIQDLDKNVLPITLWDKFALDFDDASLTKKESTEPIIIILAGMTVRSFREKIHLSTCSASKLYINLRIQEVSDYLQRLHPGDSAIQRIEAGQEQTISPQEEMLVNRKTIVELLDLDQSTVQNTKFTCKAKIANINTSFGWWYKACYNCKSAIKIYDDTFWCSNCGKNDQSPIPWYKLHIIAEDTTGWANFTIFGKTAQDLIHIPAQNLATSPSSENVALPSVIQAIIGQEHVFQIALDSLKFRTTDPSFKVIKIYTTSINAKGKSPIASQLFIKNEEHFHSPGTKKEISKELFQESPTLEVSSSSPDKIDDTSEIQPVRIPEIQPAKKQRLMFGEDCPESQESKNQK